MKNLIGVFRTIGIKSSIIVILLSTLEFIINFPYLFAKVLCYPFWWIYDNYMDGEPSVFYLIRIPIIAKFISKQEIKFDKDSDEELPKLVINQESEGDENEKFKRDKKRNTTNNKQNINK